MMSVAPRIVSSECTDGELKPRQSISWSPEVVYLPNPKSNVPSTQGSPPFLLSVRRSPNPSPRGFVLKSTKDNQFRSESRPGLNSVPVHLRWELHSPSNGHVPPLLLTPGWSLWMINGVSLWITKIGRRS